MDVDRNSETITLVGRVAVELRSAGRDAASCGVLAILGPKRLCVRVVMDVVHMSAHLFSCRFVVSTIDRVGYSHVRARAFDDCLLLRQVAHA
jgi:hypothetical protein